jgi:hypothetical protein
MRFLRLSWFEVFVIMLIATGLGWIFLDGKRLHWAAERGASDAAADLARGQINYRLRGKARPWDSAATELARANYGINVVRTGGCTCSGVDCSYDFAYNRTVTNQLRQKLSFDPIQKSLDEARVALDGEH